MKSSLNSKSILARTLATENIKVEHQPTAHTAMFDVANRVLVLPCWENMSDSLYDMFVGHEVGHALFTPYREQDAKSDKPWIVDAERIGGNVHAPYVMGLFNIIEDVRIERKVKDKFPGLRRDFVAGYRELIERDFFGTKGVDISTLSFGDRINIHFKGGVEMNVPFSDEEMKFVDAISKVETFDDMIRVGEDLYNFISGRRRNSKEVNQVPMNVQSQKNGNGESNLVGSTSMSANPNGNGDSTEKGNVPVGGDKNQDNSNNPSPTSVTNNGAGKGLAPDTLPEMVTQKKFDENKNKMVDKQIRESTFTTLPTPIIENIVLPFKDANNLISSHYSSFANTNSYCKDTMNRMNDAFNSFVANCKPLVSTLVKQFEMKKAADMQKRTTVSRTGKIDCDRIFKYKVSEDIFLRCATIAEGKNHGLVMFIDWSGSMGPCTEDVLNQVMILSLFCRRMNIPFDVYLFSSQYTVLDNIMSYTRRNNQSSTPCTVKTVSNHYGRADVHTQNDALSSFALIHLLSSEMKTRDFNVGLRNVFTLGKMVSNCQKIIGKNGYRSVPPSFGQGNTPLDSTILAAMKIVPEFQKKNKVQIVNTIFLTDGEAGDAFFGTYDYCAVNTVYCPFNKKQYSTKGYSNSTDLMLRIFSEVTGSNTIGFYIVNSSRYCKYFTGSDWAKKLRDDGFVEVSVKDELVITETVKYKRHGYDRLFVLPNKNEISEGMDALNNLSADASITKIRNTFNKTLEQRAASRGFLNRFADVIAVPKS